MQKFRVLVVDDEDDFRETLIVRLRNRGLVVDGAPSGEKALEFLENQDVDVVVLDVRMAGIDGIECLKRIKKSKPQVEVVLLTAHATVKSGIEGMHSGAFEYVMKPVPLDELLEKMELAYERKRMHEKESSLGCG